MLKRDFDFVFLSKAGLMKPVNKKQTLGSIKKLERIYCMDFFDSCSYSERVYFQELNSLLVHSSDEVDFDNRVEMINAAKALTSPILYKKEQFLKKLMGQHARLINLYPDTHSLRFSLNILQTTLMQDALNTLKIKERCALLSDCMNRLLNNIRQRACLKDKKGYFWCFMKDSTGMPYIHLNLYYENTYSNAMRVTNFLDLWVDVTKGTGSAIFFGFSEHYKNTEIYNDKTRSTLRKGLTILDAQKKHENIVMEDFNELDDVTVKYFEEASGKSFQKYLFQVARQSYSVHTLNFISHVELNNRTISPNRFSAPFDPVRARKIRSYALSS
ncbi:hypothetical protein [Enterobacter hormaechei]|uniref:hypothetical protein n=1 Tax=Enterobacteriaceae TaxID=543 RepID=UPI001785D1EB|nr:hypothetical protein [Enterobacter hormaechei]MBD8851201.1 hypothetical protein [Enterobacter hormaechei]